ncbi:MAG TPA: hypothetical protein VE869_13930 [Gemmatimonas sp.]|nr:hypothetical protein [Gemmatimonas sp.]
MRRYIVFPAVVLAGTAILARSLTSTWQSRRTVELRVESRTERAERVQGVIVSDDGVGVRTVDMMTPFVMKLSARTVNATFRAVDGASISGTMTFRVFGLATGAETRGWSQNGFILYADADQTGFTGL